MSKKYDIVKKSGSRVFISKVPNSEVMYNLTISIDRFLYEVKKNDNISNPTKVEILKQYNNMLLQINDKFKNIATKLNLPYSEPIEMKFLEI